MPRGLDGSQAQTRAGASASASASLSAGCIGIGIGVGVGADIDTGLRAAYAIAPRGSEAATAGLAALAPSWPVGAHGVALLQAWCEDATQRWLAESLETLRDWKARQHAICEALGWTMLPSDTPFFCARLPLSPARAAALRRSGIRLRDATSFGLAGHARLSVQPPAAQDALRAAWQAAERVAA